MSPSPFVHRSIFFVLSTAALAACSADAASTTQGGTGGATSSASGSTSQSVSSSSASTSSGVLTGAFPFPQEKHYAGCTYPSNASSADGMKAYQAWKSQLLTSDGAGGHLRVKRPNSPGGEVNSTVSEGIAYGMLLAVAMGDQQVFDELWKYSQQWLDANGLMNWYINAAGTTPLGVGGATDADEDMAWALVMADKQWGGGGSLGGTYLDAAKKQIDLIWNAEIDHAHGDLVLPGDMWGGKVIFNPSYFAPNEYRVFGEVTGQAARWAGVIDTGYTVIAASLNAQSGNATNGLVPAWCDVNGVPTPGSGSATNYQYDSARMPFRIGLDACIFGEPRATAYLAKTSAFFAGIGASKIVDGYDLNGAEHPDPATPAGSPQSAVFVGGAAVGAMSDPQYSTFVGDAYAEVATGTLLARSVYYNLSWTALTVLTLSGNFVDYTHLP